MFKLLNSTQRKQVSLVRSLASLFSVHVEIRLFGKVVWSYIWPPESPKIGELEDEE